MHRIAALLVALMLAVPVVWAGELAGVTMNDEVTVGDTTLKLNGMGLRKKMFVKVYVAGLYLEAPTTNDAEVVSAPGAKRVVMHFLTNKATKKKMDSAWVEGFEANSPSEYDAIRDRVVDFKNLFGDMKVGDVIEVTVVPDTGTYVVLNGKENGVIKGDDFGEALLRVWFGVHPPSDELKAGMLGV